MDCIKCRHLGQAFEGKLSEYIEALASSYYRVSTKLAAHMNVDMERSRSDLEEHQLVCVSGQGWLMGIIGARKARDRSKVTSLNKVPCGSRLIVGEISRKH